MDQETQIDWSELEKILKTNLMLHKLFFVPPEKFCFTQNNVTLTEDLILNLNEAIFLTLKIKSKYTQK